MDFYLKYRWYTIIKQCKKNSPTCHVVLFKRYYVLYHHLTLKKCCKCLMFNTILPDNVPRASFIYVRRLQLRMNINEHPLIRNTTLFCLKQYIYIYESIVRTFRFYVFSCVTSSDSLHQFSGDLPLALGDETLLC